MGIGNTNCMITKHTGQKSLFVSFCLNLAWNLSVNPTSCIRIDRQVHSIKDILDFIFFLNTFLFQNTLIGVGCSISMYGISIRSALSRFSLEITIASRPGSPPCCKKSSRTLKVRSLLSIWGLCLYPVFPRICEYPNLCNEGTLDILETGIISCWVYAANCWTIAFRTTACAVPDLALDDWIIADSSLKSQKTVTPCFLLTVTGTCFPVVSKKFTSNSKYVMPKSSFEGIPLGGHFNVLHHARTSLAAFAPQQTHPAISLSRIKLGYGLGLSTFHVYKIFTACWFSRMSFCCSFNKKIIRRILNLIHRLLT